MADTTRRGFLVFAGAGTAAAAVGAVAGAKMLGGDDAAARLSPEELAQAESFVVHVKDVRSGRMAIMVGDREVDLTDRELAQRLAGVATA